MRQPLQRRLRAPGCGQALRANAVQSTLLGAINSHGWRLRRRRFSLPLDGLALLHDDARSSTGFTPWRRWPIRGTRSTSKGARHAVITPGSQRVARVTGVIDGKWPGEPALEFGDQLAPGQQLRLSRGLLQLTFETGRRWLSKAGGLRGRGDDRSDAVAGQDRGSGSPRCAWLHGAHADG